MCKYAIVSRITCAILWIWIKRRLYLNKVYKSKGVCLITLAIYLPRRCMASLFMFQDNFLKKNEWLLVGKRGSVCLLRDHCSSSITSERRPLEWGTIFWVMNFSSRSCARSVLPLEIYRRNASRSLEKESEIVQEDFQAKKDKTKAKAGVERGCTVP